MTNADVLVPVKSEHRLFLAGCAAVVLIKIIFLILDPHAAFFLGDSMAFLGTAMTGWFPPQRSWAYGLVVGLLAFPGKGFFTLLLLQTAGGICTAVIGGWCLLRYLDAKASVAVAVMVLLAMDPLQLLYERMVMSEALSLTGMAFFLWGVLAYVHRPRWQVLVFLELAFFGAVLMRLQMLYPLVAVAIALPFLSYWKPTEGFALRTALWHLLLALILIIATHSGYRHAMGIKNQQPPSHSYGTNLILIGSFAPSVEVTDFEDPGVAQALKAWVVMSMDNRMLRNDHAWKEGGLALALIKHTGDFYTADRLAGEALRHAVLRDPLAIAVNGLSNYMDHFDIFMMSHWLSVDRGDFDFPQDVQDLLSTKFGFGPEKYRKSTLVRSWHAVGHPYYLVLALSPLVFLAAWLLAPRGHKLSLGIVCVIGVLLCFQNLALSCLPSMRLLHPVSLPFWIAVGSLISHRMKKSGRS